MRNDGSKRMDRGQRRLVVAPTEEVEMILLSVLEDLPPFIGLGDGKTWRLRKGDLVSCNPGLPYKQALVLVEKGAARWVESDGYL